jgi:hypothetical protein
VKLLNVNAFYWLASRVRLKPLAPWGGLGAIALWWLFVSTQLGFYWADELLCLATIVLLNALFKTWVAIEAGQRLAQDQQMGALELLLSTPLSAGAILRGQILALRRLFVGPLLLVVLFQCLLLYAAGRHLVQAHDRIFSLGTASLVMFALDLVSLVWVAMTTALTAKGPNQAALSTVVRLLLLPWVVFAVITVMVNVWCATRGGNIPDWKFFLSLWFWLGVGTDLLFGLPAWWNIRWRFRDLALQRMTIHRDTN